MYWADLTGQVVMIISRKQILCKTDTVLALSRMKHWKDNKSMSPIKCDSDYKRNMQGIVR